MLSSKSPSFVHDISSRELNKELVPDYSKSGSVSVEHEGEESPPLAVSYCKKSKNCHVLAVSDESGYVSLFDTRREFPSYASCQENAGKARICEWMAHQNAIFDVCWIRDDTNLLTASGDQTIKVWDVQEKKCTGVLTGHTGSVKSLYSHPTNSDLLVSGSRDESFAIWDLRCKTSFNNRSGRACISSTVMVKGAHLSPQAKRVKRRKGGSMSITSIVYLRDEVSIATGGAVDSIVKIWDSRNLKIPITQTCPHLKSSYEKGRNLHGITSLSQDLSGMFLAASCMDHRIYLYNVFQLEKGPIETFTGCQIDSFFVKSAISPDAAHILSGSSDGKAYLWQVKKPNMDPISLTNHDGEVTAVDWSVSEVGKIASSSDDFTVCIWNIQSKYNSRTRAPSSIRRNVMAPPSNERGDLVMNEKMNLPRDSDNISDELLQIQSHSPITIPEIGTPEANKIKSLSCSDSNGIFDTPEAIKSPSSVLNPPSSLKRKTIRDYFVAA
ncbi:hypothetical protein K2173_014011 [Erythroxylum novogranatense]|uniref:Denticleless protein-like protein n=1 Tax=Erythroxylum novogranatense TaxID=1862640 RepID=A0AAV8SD03_9ROSI|nr:hypothetical protein K2173_014011 [Erythroxylum novogranatense]